ncbi:Amylo-alpha-1,6-glucosidase [Beijerinckiaceae bacterium RH CH11]|nr:amylo-alpha-1,6-glucosidase [Beijerinckiaceae bacterium]VVB44609.1 Amylo-alpha-1,6-glucosidase [Beijerinckiaceae bacterium RH CH11]VVB44687.1 Amylo-alpha-1,6-glucosidase [Beijerinckiaceae bacterium RH AL8]
MTSSPAVTTEPALEEAEAHYTDSQPSLVERPLRTLKYGDMFAVLDANGDMGMFPDSPEGLFMRDTRYLSHFAMSIEGKHPLILGSVLEDDNVSLTVDLTNPEIRDGDKLLIPADAIAIDRTKFLFAGGCYERVGFCNYSARARKFEVTIRFGADFRDLFEVRGTARKARGTGKTEISDASTVTLSYTGLDEVSRFTTVAFSPKPERLEAGFALFSIELEPDAKCSIIADIACAEGQAARPVAFLRAYRANRRGLKDLTKGIATVTSTNAMFNEIACRAASDIYMLVTRTKHGLYPFAGIPWFSTVFGRDGIITAMMTLWFDPRIAEGVLRYLAATQAKAVDPAADAQPGKILHETRHGEMANLKEVPFGHYYGTVDATPLFVMLAGMYFERTGDLKTIAEIWPSIEAALAWCDESGDRDGDGFLEYIRETEAGLANQGWKDSQDSIFHADGSEAKGPIALCEVQGYLFAAKEAASTLARRLGLPQRAEDLRDEAAALKLRFHEAFWVEEIGTYALALDGKKQPCKVRSSNAGHTLFTGIADAAVAQSVADRLMSPEAFSGWGIRTIPIGEARYNPMSYHNGSIWPHDNALIVMGFARYGLKDQAVQVFSGLFDAAGYQELRRLPELFCGFVRKPRRGPTAYPVACAPQAWASATPFALVAACLGLKLDHERNEISFFDPRMPGFLDEMMLFDLRINGSSADVRLKRDHDGKDITVSVLRRTGDVRIVQVK